MVLNGHRRYPQKRIWVFAVLCVLLILSLAGAAGAFFSSVGLEQAPRCGMQEHRHSEDCYLGDVLICGRKAHVHGENCYLLRLADNDINALLSRVAASEGRSLKNVLETILSKSSADMSAIVSPGGDDDTPVDGEGMTEQTALTQPVIAALNETEARETPALVLNESLVQPAPGGQESESTLPQELLAGGAAAFALGDTPSTANNTVNFYIRLNSELTFVGSRGLTGNGNTRYITKADAAAVYTNVLETDLSASNLQNGYYLRYTTSKPTDESSFSSNAQNYNSDRLTFGSGSSTRYAILTSRSGGYYTPIDFYTLTLDRSAVNESNTTLYVESGYTYTLPTLTNAHWEDKDGNVITSVSPRAAATVYAKPDTCTVVYYVNGMEYASAAGLRINSAYTLIDLPEGFERWRSGSDYYTGGTQMTLSGDFTFTAVSHITATFRHLDGTVTTRSLLPGQSVTVPDGYWVVGTTSYTSGSIAVLEENTTFTEISGPPLTVRYDEKWSTPSGLNTPSTTPGVQGGQTTATVASGTAHTVKNVTERTVVSSFKSVPSRYGAVYFTGWRTETGDLIQPDARVSYSELAQYDGNRDGTVRLTGQWDYAPLKSVNFFMKYNSSADGSTSADAYTPVVFSAYVGGVDGSLTAEKLNELYAVEMTDGATYYSNDKIIRNLYGSDTGPWLSKFPDDNDMFQALKTYATNGQLSVPNEAGEYVTVNVNDLNEYGYAIRWYQFKVANDGNVDDWHVDGLLVRKEGRVHTTKTFSGNETLIQQSKKGFYIYAVNADVNADADAVAAADKRYIMTITQADSAERTRILTALGLTSNQITAWLTPIDDGDGDDNTLLWEFGDVKYNEAWTITEYPPDVSGSADYAEWIVVDSSALGQTDTGTGGTISVRGTTFATDLEDPEWLRAEFNNIYFRGNSLMIKKEDAATGQALAGAEFQLYQDGERMTFDYNTETGLYEFQGTGNGAFDTLVCGGYTNISTSGFAYERGDITVREVKTPAGYHSVGDVVIGYTQDTDGDGIADAAIGIKSESGGWARYDQGLLVIRNSSDPVEVTAVKRWNCEDRERADVVVQLLANGSTSTAATILRESGQSALVTLTGDHGWAHAWTALPMIVNGEAVTWSIRELKIGAESCKADYTFANWIVSYRTVVTGLDSISLVAENTPKRPMLFLKKLDISGKTAVPGAEFALVPVDKNGEPLSGAVVKTAVTDAHGELSFDNLRYNQHYRLTETLAPAGYLAFDQPAYLKLNENGNVTVKDHGYVAPAGAAYHIRVLNRTTAQLPETGGGGDTGYYAAGVMLLLTACVCAAIFLKKRRKEGAHG